MCCLCRLIRTIIWQLYYKSLRACSAWLCGSRELCLTVDFVCVTIRGSKLNAECQIVLRHPAQADIWKEENLGYLHFFFLNIFNPLNTELNPICQ